MRAYAWWMGLHSPDWVEEGCDGILPVSEWKWQDWSWLWVEQKWDNAVEHHRLLQDKFKYGPQAEILCEMYADRIPGRFEGWTSDRTSLVKYDSTSETFVSVGSLDSKLEGKHKNGIICDDLEGADAEKSDAPNEDSWHFVENRAPDLFREPETSIMVVGGTPHGEEPLVWRIRDLEGGGTLDNGERRIWALWWKPIRDEATNEPAWPARFPEDHVEEELYRASLSDEAKRRCDTQLFLMRRSVGTGHFDMERIRSNFWVATYVRGPSMEPHLVWKYRTLEQPEAVVGKEFTLAQRWAQIDPLYLRFYIHWDPAHRDRTDRRTPVSQYRPAKHAIIVVGYTPDCHALVAETWISEASIDQALDKLFLLYRKYVPYEWSFEAVGAQAYILSQVKQLERLKYHGRLTSLPTPWRAKPRRIALPSSNVQEFLRAGRTEIDKHEFILNSLQFPVNALWLHLNEQQTNLFSEFESFGSGDGTFDGLDALAQGSQFWEPGVSEAAVKAMQRRTLIKRLMERESLYETPWSTISPEAAPKPPPRPPLHTR